MKFRRLILLGTAAVVLLTGCGGTKDAGTVEERPVEASSGHPVRCPKQTSKRPAKGQRKLWIGLDDYRGPENAGILIAAERGYFEDVGIEVTITVPVTPLRALGYAAEGLTDIAVSHQPEVIFERENGTPVVAIGSLISRPTAALIWLERSKIRNVADLEGKTIAVPDLYFQEKFLGALLEEGGLTLEDVEIESIGYDLVAALVDGEADAIFDGSWNLEGAELEAQGLNPIVTRVQTTDIPAYDELVLAARTRQVSREPQLIRDFLSAVARGNAAAARDPRGVVELIEKSGETDPRLDRKGLEAAVRTTLPLLSRTGYMDPARADGLVDWMYEEGMIEQVPPTADLFTNSCLPPS